MAFDQRDRQVTRGLYSKGDKRPTELFWTFKDKGKFLSLLLDGTSFKEPKVRRFFRKMCCRS